MSAFVRSAARMEEDNISLRSFYERYSRDDVARGVAAACKNVLVSWSIVIVDEPISRSLSSIVCEIDKRLR